MWKVNEDLEKVGSENRPPHDALKSSASVAQGHTSHELAQSSVHTDSNELVHVYVSQF